MPGPLLAAEQNAKRAHHAVYERLLATAPTTLAGVIAQLEIAVEHDEPAMVEAALVGLRAIAAKDGETSASEEPAAADDQPQVVASSMSESQKAELQSRIAALLADATAPLPPENDAALIEAER